MGGSRPATVGTQRSPVSLDAWLPVLPRLFSSSNLQLLAWARSSDLFPYAQALVNLKRSLPPEATIADLLDESFHILRWHYPVEYVFKACLLKRLLFGRHSPRTTSCYFELPVGEARADMVLVNGRADVYEVKSRFDSDARLEAQLKEYYRVFTRVTIVTEHEEVARYLDRLPAHVGVATLTRRFSVSTKRAASCWYDGLDHFGLFQMLHQAERHQLAEDLRLSVSRMQPISRYRQVFTRFALSCSPWKAHERVVAALRTRQRTDDLARLCETLPQSLHVAAFSYRLRKADWTALLEVLATTLAEHPKTGVPRVLPLPT